jgi:hypothetical protein
MFPRRRRSRAGGQADSMKSADARLEFAGGP